MGNSDKALLGEHGCGVWETTTVSVDWVVWCIIWCGFLWREQKEQGENVCVLCVCFVLRRYRLVKARHTRCCCPHEKNLSVFWLFLYNRSQCEELRGLQFKKNQDEVCRERANQLVLKQEEKQRKKEGKQPHDITWHGLPSMIRNKGWSLLYSYLSNHPKGLCMLLTSNPFEARHGQDNFMMELHVCKCY